MEEDDNQETTEAEGFYETRIEAIQTGTEGMDSAEAEVMEVFMKKSTK